MKTKKTKINMNPQTRRWVFVGYNKLEEFVKGIKIMKCPKCKDKTLHEEIGYPMVNQRWRCMKCKVENYEGLNIS